MTPGSCRDRWTTEWTVRDCLPGTLALSTVGVLLCPQVPISTSGSSGKGKAGRGRDLCAYHGQATTLWPWRHLGSSVVPPPPGL